MPKTDCFFRDYFYAPQGRLQPCGMFSPSHILASSICLAAVALLLLFLKRKFNERTKLKSIRISAVLITLLEIFKIAHSFIYGDYYLDAWFPLSYCGLFIFALWMSGYGKGTLKRMGEVFISYGCPIAGIAFLIFPTTSLMIFPIWHYFSIYSLLFHSSMIFFGILFLFDEPTFSRRTFCCYACFIGVFSIVSIILNAIFASNLMNLREPYNIPIDFLQKLYSVCPILYTLLALFLFMMVPPVTALLANKYKNH